MISLMYQSQMSLIVRLISKNCLKKRATFVREIHVVDSVSEIYSMTSHVNIVTSGG